MQSFLNTFRFEEILGFIAITDLPTNQFSKIFKKKICTKMDSYELKRPLLKIKEKKELDLRVFFSS